MPLLRRSPGPCSLPPGSASKRVCCRPTIEKRQIYVINKGKPTPMPDGVLLIVPTKFTPFALSPLISPAGKVRMGMDLFIKPKTDGEDETLADFITRRLGSEALDKIAEPLMSGIYNAEAERQSVLATFPRFRTLEAQHGSLIKGMLASRAQRTATAPSNGGKPKSVFMSMQDGMTELVSAVTAELTGDLRLATTVQGITEQEDGYLLTLNEGESLFARSIVLAIPAHAAAKLLQAPAPAAASALEEIRYVSTGTISFAFRETDIQHPLNGFGVVIPRSEGRAINAVTWTSTKFDHRAPAGAVLLRCFFGGSRRPDMMKRARRRTDDHCRNELRSCWESMPSRSSHASIAGLMPILSMTSATWIGLRPSRRHCPTRSS